MQGAPRLRGKMIDLNVDQVAVDASLRTRR